MSRVTDRPARTTIPFDSQQLARQSESDEDEDLFADLELADPPSSHPRVVAARGSSPRTAVGTTPPDGVERVAPPHEVRARTVTAHDPFTTSVLAEVARRAQTIEAAPPTPPQDEGFGDDLTPTTNPGFDRR